jgi:hypothetical protein
LVQPVHPGRAITEASLEAAYLTVIDEAYGGMYSYLPDVFLTGQTFRMEVFDAREPGRTHAVLTLNVSHSLIQQIRRDLAHRAATAATITDAGARYPRWPLDPERLEDGAGPRPPGSCPAAGEVEDG